MATLLENAGFKGKLPRIWPCGGRDQTFQEFEAALSRRNSTETSILLVDSEDPIQSSDFSLDSPACWAHLKSRDGWEKPENATHRQIALMATCMETWFTTDREALRKVFGPKLRESALPAMTILEQRNRKELFKALVTATEPYGRDRHYQKGERSFKILQFLNPTTLQQHLPHFQRFLDVLRHHLT